MINEDIERIETLVQEAIRNSSLYNEKNVILPYDQFMEFYKYAEENVYNDGVHPLMHPSFDRPPKPGRYLYKGIWIINHDSEKN